MKTAAAAAATLCFFLLAIATNSEPLIDSEGIEVKSAQSYYAVPAYNETGGPGGITLHTGRNGDCPLDVVQQKVRAHEGNRIRFSPADQSITVHEYADLNVKFVRENNYCNQTLIWRVDNYDTSVGKWFITTGAVEGEPGERTLLNWFQLQPVDENDRGKYTIVHCPFVCRLCPKLCFNVGVSYSADSYPHLVLVTNHSLPLTVTLVPANGSLSSV